MKKITTAAALALSAAMLAGSTPKANAANINRTPGAFGRYVAGAAVERIFPAIWFTGSLTTAASAGSSAPMPLQRSANAMTCPL